MVLRVYCTDFAALAANVNKTSKPVMRELQLPASTKGFMMSGGEGACTLCIEGFMESFTYFLIVF